MDAGNEETKLANSDDRHDQNECLNSSDQLPGDCWNTILDYLTHNEDMKIQWILLAFISSASKHLNLICKSYKQSHGIHVTESKTTLMQEHFASKGYLSCMIYAHENGCPWDEITCYHAAYNGHLMCLQYAHENGCPWDKNTCACAASNGHLECLKYAHENGCPWKKNTCSSAALSGHFTCLKYAHENGCPWDERTCKYARKSGNEQCMQYVHENGCPCKCTRLKSADN